MTSNFWRSLWTSVKVKSKNYFSFTDFFAKIYFLLTHIRKTPPLRSHYEFCITISRYKISVFFLMRRYQMKFFLESSSWLRLQWTRSSLAFWTISWFEKVNIAGRFDLVLMNLYKKRLSTTFQISHQKQKIVKWMNLELELTKKMTKFRGSRFTSRKWNSAELFSSNHKVIIDSVIKQTQKSLTFLIFT